MICDKCGGEMTVSNVKSDFDSDIFYFKCDKCGRKRTIIVLREEDDDDERCSEPS